MSEIQIRGYEQGKIESIQKVLEIIENKEFENRVLRRTFSEGNPEGKYNGGTGIIEVNRAIQSFKKELIQKLNQEKEK